jgi:hypothetical protein
MQQLQNYKYYEGHSESNASYFIMLARNVRGGCWLNLPSNIPLNFVAMRQMTAEGQSDMEVRMKQRCVIEFLHVDKIAPNDIHQRLLNVYGDQTVDVSTVRRWVVRFSSGDSDVKDRPRPAWP